MIFHTQNENQSTYSCIDVSRFLLSISIILCISWLFIILSLLWCVVVTRFKFKFKFKFKHNFLNVFLLFLLLSLVHSQDTCPSRPKTLTFELTSRPPVTVLTPAPTSPSPKTPAAATWPRWAAASRRGVSAGSSSAARSAPSSTTLPIRTSQSPKAACTFRRFRTFISTIWDRTRVRIQLWHFASKPKKGLTSLLHHRRKAWGYGWTL